MERPHVHDLRLQGQAGPRRHPLRTTWSRAFEAFFRSPRARRGLQPRRRPALATLACSRRSRSPRRSPAGEMVTDVRREQPDRRPPSGGSAERRGSGATTRTWKQDLRRADDPAGDLRGQRRASGCRRVIDARQAQRPRRAGRRHRLRGGRRRGSSRAARERPAARGDGARRARRHDRRARPRAQRAGSTRFDLVTPGRPAGALGAEPAARRRPHRPGATGRR